MLIEVYNYLPNNCDRSPLAAQRHRNFNFSFADFERVGFIFI
ncbi:hypothetical protein [Nostoc edaphicum]|nr:hypothetical protein [Nostoc edaphicum]